MMSRKSECARHCFEVWRSCGCSRAATGPHRSSKDFAGCCLQLCRAGCRHAMTCGGSGALHDYLGRGHLVSGMHSQVTYMCAWSLLCGQRGPCGSVATVTAYMAQIPGVLDRMTRQNDISQCICHVFHFISSWQPGFCCCSRGMNISRQSSGRAYDITC